MDENADDSNQNDAVKNAAAVRQEGQVLGEALHG